MRDSSRENEKLRVLLLYPNFIPSVYLCAYLQLDHLQRSGSIEFVHRRSREVSRVDLEWASIVMFVRCHSALDEWIAHLCRKAGKRLVYVIDDDLLNVPLHLQSGEFYARKSVRNHILRTIGFCDALAAPSKRLLDKYAGMTPSRFLMIEPSAGHMDGKPIRSDGKVHIGFAGSIDRGNDVDAILADALLEIKRRYSDRVCIEFFGAQTGIAADIGAKTYPYLNSYEAYQKQMAELNWDIGLAPMPDTPFHACKHYNKLVEYSGFGIAGIYSNVAPYADVVQDGVSGLLCENTTGAWVKAISALIEDGALRRRISETCLELAHNSFSVGIAAEGMMAKLLGNAPSEVAAFDVRCFQIGKWLRIIQDYGEKVLHHGWRIPGVLIRKMRNR